MGNALIVAAVVVIVLVRRFAPRRVSEGRFYILPVVVAVIGISKGVIDSHHATLAAGLLTVEVVIGLLLGVGLGMTMRVWRGPDGGLWTKGTWATLGVLLASAAVRGGLFGIGYAAGLHVESGAIMLSVAAWLLGQSAAIAWRARAASVYS